MNRCIVLVLVALFLCACDAASTARDGYKQSQAVASDLEKSVGTKPFVGFNWDNGALTSVSINFETIPKDKQVAEIAELARASIKQQFKQKPRRIVLGFSIRPRGED